MAGRTITIEVDVDVANLGDLSKLEGTLKGTEEAASKFDSVSTGAFERVGHKVTDFASGLISSGIGSLMDGIGNSIELASAKAEAASKVQVLFGESADVVTRASENAATAVGLSSGAYLTAAGNLGNLTTNLGYTQEEAANMSVDMLTLAADLGSFNDASTEQVTEAMGAAFRGESEPIRAFGVMLSDAGVKAKALELGLYDGVGALDTNARAQATYALILEQTTAAQGDFARTSDGYANSARINAAKQEEAWASLGDKLMGVATLILPIVTLGIEAVTGVISMLFDNITILAPALAVVGGVILAVVVPPFLAWAAATLAATWPIIALAAAAVGVVAVLRHFGILDWLIGLFQTIAGVIGGVVQAAIGGLQSGLRGLTPVFDVVGGVVGRLGQVFGAIFGVIAQVVTAAVGVVRGVLTFLTPLFAAIGAGLGILGRVFGSIFDGISRVVSTAINAVLGVFRNMWAGIQSVGSSIGAFLGRLWQPLSDGLNRVIGIIKGLWNGFVRFWNGVGVDIPRIEILGQVFGGGRLQLPQLPYLSAGGIVTSPTLAVVGEAGPEAVVPLGRLPGGNTYHITVQTGIGDPVEIGRQAVEAIRRFERANGPAFG